MTITIWSPSPGDSRNPYIAVARMGAPITVVVQILIADNLHRNITPRWRSVMATVAVAAPRIEIIVAARFKN
jgi:hypothetical protein